MELEAIRFFGYPSNDQPCVFQLKFGSGEDLKDVRERTRLGVLLFKNSDLELLCEYQGAVRDRGQKHPAKGLLTHLLDGKRVVGDTRMPLLRCEYRELARLKSSIRRLLERASELGERNTFLVGVQPDRFDELRTEIQFQRARPSADTSASKTHPQAEPSWWDEALRLLRHQTVPEEVSTRYLGTSKDVKLVHQMIMRAAEITHTVLIIGESGTGKELVAWSIHEQSSRRTGPFRAVNCGAIPSELFESELFGTWKHAYTGATDKEGLWKQAHGGTLFLDEIGDLAPFHQVKILRAIDDKRIRRVGGLDDEPVDVRIIAATNRNLASLVESGHFREDLYYRIHGLVVYTPPLRSHPEDIPPMAMRFWAQITGDASRTLSSEVLEELKNRRWLGNGRELKMFLMSMHGLFGDQTITLSHLRVVEGHPGLVETLGKKSSQTLERSLHRMDQLRHMQRILEVLTSLKASLRPLLVENVTDLRTTTLVRVVLQSYVEKLESLGGQAEMFGNAAARKAVIELSDALRDFARVLETSAGRAREFWQKNVQPKYHEVDTTCFAEIQRLLAGVEK